MNDSGYGQVSLLEKEVHEGRAHGAGVPSRERGQAADALMDILFGSAAGMLGKVFEYPFDTVKVRLQAQPDTSTLRYTGPLDCFSQSIKTEGIRSLYKGISAPMVGAALETSSLFFTYRLAQKALYATTFASDPDRTLPLSALVMCGAASGALTSIILTPVELVKCQLQVPRLEARSARYGPVSVISSVYRNHGIGGFWHGQLGTLIRETGGSAAWFGSYEGVTSLLCNHRQHSDRRSVKEPVQLWQQLLAGACAGMCYNFVFYPADTIKSRMQTEDVPQTSTLASKRRTFLAVARELWHQQGIRGMYRGCGITVARSAPSSALIFTVYEWLRACFS